MLPTTISIARRYCGPPNSGNGGYVCGLIARHVPGPATVRLHSPPPLESELTIESAHGAVRLLHGSVLVGEARPATVDLAPPQRPSLAAAQEASKSYLGFTRHSFPGCFVCGTHRREGDGLRIFAGPLDGGPAVAAPWMADASLARDGAVAPEFLWAALDCPGAFAVLPLPEGRTILLGELSARIDGTVRAGERCVAMGWPIRIEGRKRMVGSALVSEAGAVIGVARATWIEVAESAFTQAGAA